MINVDESALICDLAETYHIYEYKELSPKKIALFSVGLRDNSRIKLKMSGMKHSLQTMLLAGIVDRLSLLVWQNTKDGADGNNVPHSILDALLGVETTNNKEYMTFTSGEEFEKQRKQILERRVING